MGHKRRYRTVSTVKIVYLANELCGWPLTNHKPANFLTVINGTVNGALTVA